MIQTTAATLPSCVHRPRVGRPAFSSVVLRINVVVTRIALGIGHVGARVPFSRRDAPAGAITITGIVPTSATTLRDDDGRYDRDNKEIRELVRPDDSPFAPLGVSPTAENDVDTYSVKLDRYPKEAN